MLQRERVNGLTGQWSTGQWVNGSTGQRSMGQWVIDNGSTVNTWYVNGPKLMVC